MRIFTLRFFVNVARAYSLYRRNEASEVTTDFSSPCSYAERMLFSSLLSFFIFIVTSSAMGSGSLSTGNDSQRCAFCHQKAQALGILSTAPELLAPAPRSRRKRTNFSSGTVSSSIGTILRDAFVTTLC